ncbi:hypothetical protein [Fluviicola sp.]|uniref:hypothetical protein n=1 Tax=Fluviicola sp. TaxID=1917219 RepID=UPI0031D8F989
MKNKNLIVTQLENYEKSYEETKDFERFKINIYQTIQDIESITPVNPVYSSYLFQIKLDYENLDRNSSPTLVSSLKTFLKRLE